MTEMKDSCYKKLKIKFGIMNLSGLEYVINACCSSIDG